MVTAERVGVLALFGYAAVALATRRAGVTGGEAVAWALSVLLAVAVAGWTSDVQFLRAANEGIGLSVLAALADRRSRAGRWALLLAAAWPAGSPWSTRRGSEPDGGPVSVRTWGGPDRCHGVVRTDGTVARAPR